MWYVHAMDAFQPYNRSEITMYATAWMNFTVAAATSLQSCPTLCDPIDGRQPTRRPHPWDSPGKNTGVGCHFLLQCMKVKSLSRVRLLVTPTDYSPPGSSVHGIFQARVLEWGAIAFSVTDTSSFQMYVDVVMINKIIVPMKMYEVCICTPVLLPGKSPGWRSLVGCSP